MIDEKEVRYTQFTTNGRVHWHRLGAKDHPRTRQRRKHGRKGVGIITEPGGACFQAT